MWSAEDPTHPRFCRGDMNVFMYSVTDAPPGCCSSVDLGPSISGLARLQPKCFETFLAMFMLSFYQLCFFNGCRVIHQRRILTLSTHRQGQELIVSWTFRPVEIRIVRGQRSQRFYLRPQSASLCFPKVLLTYSDVSTNQPTCFTAWRSDSPNQFFNNTVWITEPFLTS